ncbi:MAG: hypothetical protein MPW15_09105 [Candidatus Manganitrophus sp.]|nr:hypothetical protein [Candidatus Manganitrophus sp.]
MRGAEAKLKLGEEKSAEKMLGDLVRILAQEGAKKSAQLKETSSFYRAKAHLLLADIEMKRYEAIQLVSPSEKNLQKKKSLFDRLLQNYGQAAAGSFSGAGPRGDPSDRERSLRSSASHS